MRTTLAAARSPGRVFIQACCPWRCARGEHPSRPLFEGLPLALFTDIEPTPQPRKHRWIGWIILGTALVGVVVVALVPAPYVIEQPGPVYNVLGDVTVSGKQVALIDIPSEKTYQTGGALDMLTVSLRGDRAQPPS